MASRRADGKTTLYFYDPATGRLVEETDGAGQTVVAYLLGGRGEALRPADVDADGTAAADPW